MSHRSAACYLSMAVLLAGPAIGSAEVYEMRTYTTNPAKLDDLHSRFRDHTVELFKKHGMESVGYWVPTHEPKSTNTLIYILRHKSREAAKASWAAFLSDPEWQEVFKQSEADGPILAIRPESVYMSAADYSPKFTNDKEDDEAVFELRIYRTSAGKRDDLDARFRDHTIRIFNRFGMKSVGYWHPLDEPDSSDTLVYILRHDGRATATTSWKSFADDPEWKKVAQESQKDGRILRERPVSIFMKATDYSAIH